MKISELIAELQKFDPEAEVIIRSENDECDVCAGLKHEKCSLAGLFDWPYIDIKEDRGHIVLSGF